MFKKLAQHNILCYDGQYCCHLCNSVILNFKDVLEHVNGTKHLASKYSEMFNKFTKKYTKEACKEFADNNLAIAVNYNFICVPCRRNFDDFLDVLQHVQKNKSHIKKLKDSIICDKIKDGIANCMNKFKLTKDKAYIFDPKLLLGYLNACQDYESYINDECDKCTLSEVFQTLHNYTNKEYKTLVNNGIIMYEYFLPVCRICDYIPHTSKDILHHKKANHSKVIIQIQQKENINNNKEKIQHEENIKNDTGKLQKIQNINNNNEGEKQQKYVINNNEEVSLFIGTKSLKKQDNSKSMIDNINSEINNELLGNRVIICGYTNFLCILCMCDIKTLRNILIHIKGKAHKNHNASISINDAANNEILNTNESNIASQSSLHYCESCKNQIDINDLFGPSNTVIHRCNLFSMTMGNDVILYKCICCKSCRIKIVS